MAHSASSSASAALTRTELLTHLSISFAALVVLANTFRGDGEPLIASAALSLLAFSLSHAMIRWLGPTFIKAGFKGRDLSKPHRPEIPECMGAVCAAVYLLVVMIFIPFPFYKDIVAATSGGGNRDVVLEVEYIQQGRFLHKFPHSKVGFLVLSSPLAPLLCDSHYGPTGHPDNPTLTDLFGRRKAG